LKEYLLNRNMARLNSAHFFDGDFIGDSPCTNSRKFMVSKLTNSPQSRRRPEPIEINNITREDLKIQNDGVVPYQGEDSVEKQQPHTKFKRCLLPLLFLMKLAGLYFDDSCKIKLLNKLNLFWSYLINCCIVAYFASYCRGIFSNSCLSN